MTSVRIAVRVRPGASRTRVGGTYGDDQLVVAVTSPPVDGAANEAVIIAVAEALGLRPRQVSVFSGSSSRSKVLDVDANDADDVGSRIAALLSSPGTVHP